LNLSNPRASSLCLPGRTEHHVHIVRIDHRIPGQCRPSPDGRWRAARSPLAPRTTARRNDSSACFPTRSPSFRPRTRSTALDAGIDRRRAHGRDAAESAQIRGSPVSSISCPRGADLGHRGTSSPCQLRWAEDERQRGQVILLWVWRERTGPSRAEFVWWRVFVRTPSAPRTWAPTVPTPAGEPGRPLESPDADA